MSQRQYQSAPASFKPPGTHHTNPAAPFPNESSIWEAYVNEAVVVDNELVKDWASSLNFLLVFAAIFSSVLSAFIIESKQMLEQDPANVMVDALIFFINNTANGTHTPYSTPAFSAPSYAVSVNCLFFTSLSASILAALASVVSLQWIAEYDAAVSRSGSSPEDRTKRRQFRYGGMEKWKMKEIIAALPILLYCSLVLFFVGVAQWMWGVHKTVGGVVLGGILLGGSFYFITTLVAVVFPSCPYRAPIVRWIYISFHFLFRSFSCSSHSQKSGPKGGVAVAPKFLPFTQVILTKLDYIRKAASNVPGYITTFPDRFRNLNIQERDQDYIISDDKSLINDSLAWLAQNISISRDSHHRLLLLAQEASKLDAEQQTSKQFKKIPWSEIFRLLGNKYIQCARSKKLTEQDEEDLTTLLRCLRNPRIGPFIAPEQVEEYIELKCEDPSQDEPETEGPNPVYLLLRNIQSPGMRLSIEEQVKLRIGCLNQAHFVSQSIKDSASFHGDLISKGTANICDHLISYLAEELLLLPHDDAQDRINNLVCLAHLGQPFLESLPVRFLNWRSAPKSSNLIYQLACAGWIYSQNNHPYIHRILGALCAAQRRNPNVSLLWRFEASDEEIITGVATLTAEDRQFVAPYIRHFQEHPQYLLTLTTFDQLIARGCTFAQRDTIIELMCNDLKNASLYSNWFHIGEIMGLSDPELRLCGLLAAELYEQLDESSLIHTRPLTSSLKQFLGAHLLVERPLDRMIHRLQIRFWEQMTTEDKNRFLEQVLGNLDTLKYLAGAFTQPNMGIDYGGDFLLQIIYLSFTPRLRVVPLTIDPGPSTNFSFHLRESYGICYDILLLLAYDRSVPFEVQVEPDNKSHKPEYVGYLLELCDDIRRSPSRLIRLLIQIAESFRPPWTPRLALDLHHILNSITNHCLGNNALPYTAEMHQLAVTLVRLQTEIIASWEGLLYMDELMSQLGSKDDFSTRCTEVIHRLVCPRVTTFGLAVGRSIACARPFMVSDAATGWLGMYDGERFKPQYIAKVPLTSGETYGLWSDES